MPIHFFSEDIDFQICDAQKIKNWIQEIIQTYDFRLSETEDLNYIFCSDNYLYQINVDYLSHDTLTDIITFDNSEKLNEIVGDIFISIDRVRENAQDLNINFEEELHRVLAHGILHLLGFQDKTKIQAEEMRQKENECLGILTRNDTKGK